jgi:predicted alpha/beta hydrolase family esterase
MTNYFIVPGLGNSGPEHWQTYFESTGLNFKRINQKEWDAPQRDDWVTTIDEAIVNEDPSKAILIGHSLGCSTIAHWAHQYNRKIKGALLVAPSDIEAQNYTFPAKGFAPVPLYKINFPTIVVASTNDQWASLDRAKLFADKWGSRFINIGDAGHINAASGHYEWGEGLEILKMLG